MIDLNKRIKKSMCVFFILSLILFISCFDRTLPGNPRNRAGNSNTYTESNNAYYTEDAPFSETDRSLSQDQQLKVPLSDNEYLLQVINTNLDLDVSDEQVIIVKIVDDPELPIKLAVIDYDEIMSSYIRTWESFTNGTNHQIFEIEFLDIVGDYNKEIIFHGMKNKDLTLDVFRRTPSLSNPGLYFKPICQLVSDGTITIKRKKRAATYELGQKTGESFPIIVERRDKDSDNENDMLRETYRWVYSSNKYEFIPPAEKNSGGNC